VDNFFPHHLTFVFDNRLMPLFRRTYSKLAFLPVPKMYRWNAAIPTLKRFSRLPRMDICDLMTNDVVDHYNKQNTFISFYSVLSDYIESFDNVDAMPKPRTLACSEKLIAHWSQYLVPHAGKTLVGVCWRSSLESTRTKSMQFTIEQLAPLLEMDNIQLVNLQYTEMTVEEKTFVDLHFPGKILTLGNLDLIDDLDGSAALINCLDYVVSIPNSIGTLSACLGVKTFIMSVAQPGYFLTRANSDTCFHFESAELVYADERQGKSSVVQKICQKICDNY
jgi:capsular polysaccharide export protein